MRTCLRSAPRAEIHLLDPRYTVRLDGVRSAGIIGVGRCRVRWRSLRDCKCHARGKKNAVRAAHSSKLPHPGISRCVTDGQRNSCQTVRLRITA